jgi:hypothetical protein
MTMHKIQQLHSAYVMILQKGSYKEGVKAFTEALSDIDASIYDDLIFPALYRTGEVSVSAPAIENECLKVNITHKNGHCARVSVTASQSLAAETTRTIIGAIEADTYMKEEAKRKEKAFKESL